MTVRRTTLGDVMIARRAVSAMMGLVLGATAAHAAEPAAPAPAQPPLNASLRAVRNLLEASPSPDGRQVAAVVTDSTEDGGRPHLWLLSADGRSARQATFSTADSETGERSAGWAADGSALYFLAKRGDARRLYRLSLAGGEAEPLKIARPATGALVSGWSRTIDEDAAVETDVVGYEIAPDRPMIAVIAADRDTAARAAQIKKKDDGVEVGRDDVSKVRLYLVDAATGAAQDVALPGDVTSVRWGPGSTALTVVTTPADEDDVGPAARAWRVEVGAAGPVELKGLPRTLRTAALSPLGLVYEAQCAIDAPPGCNDLYVQDRGTGASRNLTRDLDGSLGSTMILARDGRSVVVDMLVGLRSRLARIDLATGRIDGIDGPDAAVAGAATNPAQTAWAVVASGSTTPRAVWFSRTLGAPAVKLAGPALVSADWPATPSRTVTWTNDGLTLQGLYYAPALAPGAKAPLVVVAHGGPTGAFEDSYSNLAHLLVAQGWAVFTPNPRGSVGRGAAFSAANKNDLGGGDYRDIMTGVDAVLAAYPVDPQRMALIGYSYGGEMAGFVEGRTDRFKALVSGAPVIDQFSEYGTENGSWYDRWFYGLPWEHFADAWRQSPLARVGQARTPLLLLQGEADPTDPLGQSQEMRRAMKQIGAPVTLVTYPRETHATLGAAFSGGVTREPWHGDDLRRRMIAFLADAFAGKSPAPPAPER